ncbi:MAG: hypothetical protein WCG47_04160 [Dermatophilaceae bacterium]
MQVLKGVAQILADPKGPGTDDLRWAAQGVPPIQRGFRDAEDLGDLTNAQQRAKVYVA